MRYSIACIIIVLLVFAMPGCGSGEREEKPNAESVHVQSDERAILSSVRNEANRLVSEINGRELAISKIAESAFCTCATTAVDVASILWNTYPASVVVRLNPPDAEVLIRTNGDCLVSSDISLPTPFSVLEVENMWDAARKCRQSADMMLDGLRAIRADAMKLSSEVNAGGGGTDAEQQLFALTSQCKNVTGDARKFNFLAANELLKEKGELAVRKAHKDVAKAKRMREMSEKKRQWKQIQKDRMSFVPAGAEDIARLKQSFAAINAKNDIDGATKALKEFLPNILPRGVWFDKLERYPQGNWRVVVSEIGTKPYLPWTVIVFADGTLAKCDWGSLTELAKIECVAMRQGDEYSVAFRLAEEFMPIGTNFTDPTQIPGYENHPMSSAQLSVLKVQSAKPLTETRLYYNANGGHVVRVSVTLNADGSVREISGESIGYGIGNAVYSR